MIPRFAHVFVGRTGGLPRPPALLVLQLFQQLAQGFLLFRQFLTVLLLAALHHVLQLLESLIREPLLLAQRILHLLHLFRIPALLLGKLHVFHHLPHRFKQLARLFGLAVLRQSLQLVQHFPKLVIAV